MTAAASGAIGKYGRCGSIMTFAFFGTTTLPDPNGQIPASARNSVDLPEPDGPVTRTRSPPVIVISAALTSGAPFGRRTARSLTLTADVSPAAIVMTGGAVAIACAVLTDRSKPASRSMTA